MDRITLLHYLIIILQTITTQKGKKTKLKQRTTKFNNVQGGVKNQLNGAVSIRKKRTKKRTRPPIRNLPTRKSQTRRKVPPKTRTMEHNKKLIRKTKLKIKSSHDKLQQEDNIPEEVRWLQEDPQDQLLSRFVETPKGTKVGESIGIEKSELILKNKLNFYLIPLNYVKEKDGKLILRRKVNWSSAAKLGDAWRRRALDIIRNKKQKRIKSGKVK